jgi:alpha-D-ribose 1-methylphosphonate 5-triphosphate synthase subunit PhnG
MLQAVDNAERARWMGLLARAPLAMLQSWAARRQETAFTWLRRPETGLVMVRARAGGTGSKFNLGEMTVTRCVLRLAGGAVGVSYIQGRSARKAEIAALADAFLQEPASRTQVREELIEPLQLRLDAEAARMQRKAQATRVEFFTLAREAGA